MLLYVPFLCYEILTIYVTYRRSTQGNAGTHDWLEINAEHITRWMESGPVDVVVPAGQYDDITYWEYLSWYQSCTRATLLSGNVSPAPRPFPEDRTQLLHVVVSDVVLITIFISFSSVLLT